MVVQKKSYTLPEYQTIVTLPENADKLIELIDGEMIEKMPSFTPSRLALRIAYFIMQHVMQTESGYVTGADGGYVIDNENVFIPDVGYISKERLPEAPTREVPMPPDMAVEVKSPTDRIRALRRKAETYLANGTRLVWLVFPEEQVVEVYIPDADVTTVDIDGILSGGDVLPDFTLAVRNIFA